MAKLTPEDEKKYEDLQNAFSKHNNERDKDPTVMLILTSIGIETKPLNTGELRQKIDALDIYLKILDLLDVELFRVLTPTPPVDPKKEEEKEKIKRVFFNSFDYLKNSLKVVENEDLNLTGEIEDKQLSRVILEFVNDTTEEKNKSLTKSLLDGSQPDLTETQIKQLITSWGSAVSMFVKDASNGDDVNGKFKPADLLDPANTQKTLAAFFCIHNELEILYTNLADNETVQGIS
jgi:hypothetical protein